MKPNDREVKKFLHDTTDAELEGGLAELKHIGDDARGKFIVTLDSNKTSVDLPDLPPSNVDPDLEENNDDSLIRGIPTELDDDFKQAA